MTDPHMRRLLQTGRRAAGSLSQREAAERAGISAVYWQKIESGAQLQVPADTLAAMFTGVGVTASQLKAEGYAELADACADLMKTMITTTAPDAEDHLAATPGATDDEISALQAVWRALRAQRTPEPFEQELRRSKKTPD